VSWFHALSGVRSVAMLAIRARMNRLLRLETLQASFCSGSS
jgi:hypothetical protein